MAIRRQGLRPCGAAENDPRHIGAHIHCDGVGAVERDTDHIGRGRCHSEAPVRCSIPITTSGVDPVVRCGRNRRQRGCADEHIRVVGARTCQTFEFKCVSASLGEDFVLQEHKSAGCTGIDGADRDAIWIKNLYSALNGRCVRNEFEGHVLAGCGIEEERIDFCSGAERLMQSRSCRGTECTRRKLRTFDNGGLRIGDLCQCDSRQNRR